MSSLNDDDDAMVVEAPEVNGNEEIFIAEQEQEYTAYQQLLRAAIGIALLRSLEWKDRESASLFVEILELI